MTANKTTYKRDEFGTMVETNDSIKRHIVEEFGFMKSRIVLLEATYKAFNMRGTMYQYCTGVSFSVNGRGFSARLDAVDFWRDTAYDTPED